MNKLVVALILFAPCLAEANIYLTTAGAGLTNAITITPVAGTTPEIRTASSGQETSTATTGNHALTINAGLGGTLNLNTVSTGDRIAP